MADIAVHANFREHQRAGSQHDAPLPRSPIRQLQLCCATVTTAQFALHCRHIWTVLLSLIAEPSYTLPGCTQYYIPLSSSGQRKFAMHDKVLAAGARCSVGNTCADLRRLAECADEVSGQDGQNPLSSLHGCLAQCTLVSRSRECAAPVERKSRQECSCAMN